MKRFLVLTALLSVLLMSAQTEEVDRLTVELTYQNQDTLKVDKSLRLISVLLDNKAYNKALLYTNQTIDLSKSLNYNKGLAEANYYKAQIYSTRGDYFNAIDNYSKSLNYYQSDKDTIGTARVSHKLGLLEISRGNYRKGLRYSLSAISIFEQNAMQYELGSAYDCLAEAYLKTGNFTEALDYNTKALMTRKSLGDSTGIKISTIKIAELYSKRKEHRKAIEFYNNALALVDETQEKELYGELLPKLGTEHLIFKEFNTAAEYLLKGLRFNRRLKYPLGLVLSLNGLGNLNYQQGKYKTAEAQLLEAFNLATANNFKNELLDNYQIRIELDASRGYFQNAFKWQTAFYELKEDIDKDNSMSYINDPIEDNTALNLWENKPVEKEEIATKNSLTGLSVLEYILIAISLLCLGILVFYFTKFNDLKNDRTIQSSSVQGLKTKILNLEQENEDLGKRNEVKDKLFSIVSHDLKDSISSIKAFLDLLKEDSISREEFNELVPELSENANNASALLYNLLNWSKSQLQSLKPKAELFNIQDVFKDKIELIEQKLDEKNIIVIDESERDFIYADKSMIEIVIQNLITNAVKFSRHGDMITISNSEVNGRARICVEDTGVGISEENIAKLFNASNNFTTRGTQNEKGTGLGLNIAKDLIELNQGKIWVESTLNVGSKFFIELPKSAPKA